MSTSEPVAVLASRSVKSAYSEEHRYALRVRVDNACTAMSDTFGELDHRTQQMFRTVNAILEPGTDASVSLAAAYCAWCTSNPDEIVRVPTRPCRCDNGWTEVDPETAEASMTVRPCSRCNLDVYTKYFEGVRQVEQRMYDQAGNEVGKAPYDPEEDW